MFNIKRKSSVSVFSLAMIVGVILLAVNVAETAEQNHPDKTPESSAVITEDAQS